MLISSHFFVFIYIFVVFANLFCFCSHLTANDELKADVSFEVVVIMVDGCSICLPWGTPLKWLWCATREASTLEPGKRHNDRREMGWQTQIQMNRRMETGWQKNKEWCKDFNFGFIKNVREGVIPTAKKVGMSNMKKKEKTMQNSMKSFANLIN